MRTGTVFSGESASRSPAAIWASPCSSSLGEKAASRWAFLRKAWDAHRCSTHAPRGGTLPPQRCSPDDGDSLAKAELAASALYAKKRMKTPKETKQRTIKCNSSLPPRSMPLNNAFSGQALWVSATALTSQIEFGQMFSTEEPEHGLPNRQVLLQELKTTRFGERVFACWLFLAQESHFPPCQQGQEGEKRTFAF